MASPPVVKFLDFGQYKYELTKREKENKRRQRSVTFKEVRLSPKIGIGDFDTKVHRAIEFLEDGDRIKVTVRFRGRELTHPELGRNMLARFTDRIKDHGVAERAPLLEGKSMHLTVASIHKPKEHETEPEGSTDGGSEAAEAKDADAPKATEAAAAEAPKAQAPKAEAPKAEAPKATEAKATESPAATEAPAAAPDATAASEAPSSAPAPQRHRPSRSRPPATEAPAAAGRRSRRQGTPTRRQRRPRQPSPRRQPHRPRRRGTGSQGSARPGKSNSSNTEPAAAAATQDDRPVGASGAGSDRRVRPACPRSRATRRPRSASA